MILKSRLVLLFNLYITTVCGGNIFRRTASEYSLTRKEPEDGIDIDDCEKVHRAIDPLIDKADPIEESYLLEVSSPGIERRLRTPEHFLACIGETVNLKLFAPIEGDERTKSKQIIAPMIAFDPETKNVTVEDGTENGLIVPWNLISRANIWYDFGD